MADQNLHLQPSHRPITKRSGMGMTMETNLIVLTDETFDEQVRQSSLPVLVDFYADWCGPCKQLAPIIEALAEAHQSKLKVCKLNVDDAPETAGLYRIMSIPTLLLFQNGEVAERIIGALPKEALEEKLRTWL